VWRKFFLVIMSLWFSAPAVAGNEDYFLFREGYQYWQAGNALKAYAVFESIRRPLPPIDDLKLYATVMSAAQSGRAQQAASVMAKLSTEYPNSPWRAAAEAGLSQMQAPPESVALAPKLSADSAALNLYVTQLFKGRDYKKAVPVLEELLKRKGGSDVQLMMTLASAFARSSRYDEAIAMQRKIMNASSQEARRALYKIVFLQADRNHDKEAIAGAREYLDRYPNGAERLKVLWIQAWSSVRLKEWTSALTQLENYRDAVGARDEKRRAEYWMARCLEMMGNKSGAMTAYGVISGQNAADYYGVLASARLRHKPIDWQLPAAKKMSTGKLNTDSAASLLASLGMFELMPVLGWDGSYRDFVDTVALRWGLTPGLVNAIIQTESHFRQDALSPAGAIGLMQLIPPTAQTLVNDLHIGFFASKQLYDPIWNVTLGMAYLRKLSAMFSRQLVPMIASYNAGEQAVKRWTEQTPLTDPEIFIEEIPYDETYAYVKKVLTLMW
jgi:soluble lytic murein transglycosylase